jgi:hypothetical protein
MDIYDQLEQLVPPERKEDFLRLSRQLKEYGDHNPELLRIVEAMGFLSLYTEKLPERVGVAIEHARAQLAAELKALQAEHLSALRAFNANQRLIKTGLVIYSLLLDSASSVLPVEPVLSGMIIAPSRRLFTTMSQSEPRTPSLACSLTTSKSTSRT